jgi:hypothetical protein
MYVRIGQRDLSRRIGSSHALQKHNPAARAAGLTELHTV